MKTKYYDDPESSLLSEIAVLKAERDELLAALKRAEQHLRFLSIAMDKNQAATILCADVANQARAAIAKVEASKQ